MEIFLIKAIQLILSLSILVIVHEYGHYLFSRLFNIRVEKFYMFFNPSFSIVRAKKINGKMRVKFFAKNTPGLINESSNEDASESNASSEDWNRHPNTTEWGIGWVPLGGYCKISGMIDE
ncbi:MAG: RIP metalloprotease RseP, partial [Bacteroidales bacterium]|nr:RIP metalloprotease RseP [Bacteroidales bacterium]